MFSFYLFWGSCTGSLPASLKLPIEKQNHHRCLGMDILCAGETVWDPAISCILFNDYPWDYPIKTSVSRGKIIFYKKWTPFLGNCQVPGLMAGGFEVSTWGPVKNWRQSLQIWILGWHCKGLKIPQWLYIYMVTYNIHSMYLRNPGSNVLTSNSNISEKIGEPLWIGRYTTSQEDMRILYLWISSIWCSFILARHSWFPTQVCFLLLMISLAKHHSWWGGEVKPLWLGDFLELIIASCKDMEQFSNHSTIWYYMCDLPFPYL